MAATPTIRLDRSRPYGTVHKSEAVPGDPEERVAYWQKVGGTNLPFDAHDNLVPDDGKTEPWVGTIGYTEGGQPITRRFHPLYSEEMRKAVKARLTRVKARKPEPEPDDEVEARPSVEHVNLAAYMRGEETGYTIDELRRAVEERYGVKCGLLERHIIEALYDAKIIPEAEMHPAVLAKLDAGRPAG